MATAGIELTFTLSHRVSGDTARVSMAMQGAVQKDSSCYRCSSGC
jgi:hypothetical protein